jgi:hypothetical protein
MYERQLLRELEALRPDVENADKKTVPANGIPKPSVIPPLEDFSKPRPPQPSASAFVQRPVPPSPTPAVPPKSPLSHRPHVSFNSPQQGPPQTPGAGPSNPTPQPPRPPLSDEPPLGGRLVDGTKSMFIKPPSGPQAPPIPSFTPGPAQMPKTSLTASSPTPVVRSSTDPLLGAPIPFVANTANGHIQQKHSEVLDPLTQRKPNQFMSASMRVHPTRPRLDPREAASKLANMF